MESAFCVLYWFRKCIKKVNGNNKVIFIMCYILPIFCNITSWKTRGTNVCAPSYWQHKSIIKLRQYKSHTRMEEKKHTSYKILLLFVDTVVSSQSINVNKNYWFRLTDVYNYVGWLLMTRKRIWNLQANGYVVIKAGICWLVVWFGITNVKCFIWIFVI